MKKSRYIGEDKCKSNIKKKIKKSTEKFDWGKIDMLDVVPGNDMDMCPILFAPGWSITINSIQDFLTFLSDYNYRVISLNHKRLGGARRKSEEGRKATSILAILKRKDIKLVNAVGYSEGCTNVLLAANMRPEKFHHIILIDPPGLGRKKSQKMGLVKNFVFGVMGIGDGRSGRKKRRHVFFETIKYILSNPIRSYKEIREIANSDLIELLRGLNRTHVKIFIVQNIDDRMSNLKDIQERLKKTDANVEVNKLYTVDGGHFDLVKSPCKYARLVNDVLTKEGDGIDKILEM